MPTNQTNVNPKLSFYIGISIADRTSFHRNMGLLSLAAATMMHFIYLIPLKVMTPKTPAERDAKSIPYFV